MSDKNFYFCGDTAREIVNHFDNLDFNNPQEVEAFKKKHLEPLCLFLQDFSKLCSLLQQFFYDDKREKAQHVLNAKLLEFIVNPNE